MASYLDTINYEITCLIGPRVPRVYVDEFDETIVVEQKERDEESDHSQKTLRKRVVIKVMSELDQ